MQSPTFPFVRDRVHKIGELRAFEAELLRARQADSELTKRWRVPEGEIVPWAKIREETYSIKLLADKMKLPDEASFRLSPLSHSDTVDAEIWSAEEGFKLQITTADPIWTNKESGSQNGGYTHRLAMEALNRDGVIFGVGPFRRESEVGSDFKVLSPEDDLRACMLGLQAALRRKIDHDGSGCRLLIFARSYFMRTIDLGFDRVVRDALAAFGVPSFDWIYVLDQNPDCFVSIARTKP